MKIIGTVNDEFILQASKDEIAKISGAKWWGEELRQRIGTLGPGTTIPISPLWKLIEGIQDSESTRKAAIGAIGALMKLTAGVDETLEEYLEEVKQKSRVKTGSPEK